MMLFINEKEICLKHWQDIEKQILLVLICFCSINEKNWILLV